MHDTFLSLLQDRAHWEFELFLMVLFDGIVAGILWPFVRLHWRHHIDRDRRDGSDIKWAKKVGDVTTDTAGNVFVCAGPTSILGSNQIWARRLAAALKAGPAEKPAKTCSVCKCEVTEMYSNPLDPTGATTCWYHADNFFMNHPERFLTARLRHRDVPNTVPLKPITKTD